MILSAAAVAAAVLVGSAFAADNIHGDPVIRRAMKPFVESGELPAGVSMVFANGKLAVESFGGVGTTSSPSAMRGAGWRAWRCFGLPRIAKST